MSESAVIVVCALVAITALGNSANLTNRSVERNSFETFSSDGQFIIGKNATRIANCFQLSVQLVTQTIKCFITMYEALI